VGADVAEGVITAACEDYRHYVLTNLHGLDLALREVYDFAYVSVVGH
jgi:hypothetical protein